VRGSIAGLATATHTGGGGGEGRREACPSAIHFRETPSWVTREDPSFDLDR